MSDHSSGPNRIPRRPWTPEEDATLLRLARAKVQQVDIGRQMGRSGASVSSRMEKLHRQFYKPHKQLTKRPCLCCQRPFDSEGIHNRICATCKTRESWDLPVQFQMCDAGHRSRQKGAAA